MPESDLIGSMQLTPPTNVKNFDEKAGDRTQNTNFHIHSSLFMALRRTTTHFTEDTGFFYILGVIFR